MLSSGSILTGTIVSPGKKADSELWTYNHSDCCRYTSCYTAPPLGRRDLVPRKTSYQITWLDVGHIVIWTVSCSPQSSTPSCSTTFDWFRWLRFVICTRVPNECHCIIFDVSLIMWWLRLSCTWFKLLPGLIDTILGWCMAGFEAIEVYNKSLSATSWFLPLRLNSIGDI